MQIWCKKATEVHRGSLESLSRDFTGENEWHGFNEVQKIYKEKQRVRSYFVPLSSSCPSNFFSPGFLFKVLGNVTNSLFLCSANEICK